MRKSLSADCLLSQSTVQTLIKKHNCKTLNKYKTYALISGSVLLSCYSINNDIRFEVIGSILTTGYFTVNVAFSYVENYLNQLDEWREAEARYEEKTDPPEWNWKIINYTSHLAIIFSLLACITQDINDDNYFYLGNGLQVISIGLRIKNDISIKNLTVCFMDFISILMFVINKFYSSKIIILFGTYIYAISELISI
jgi:hypothetical protein